MGMYKREERERVIRDKRKRKTGKRRGKAGGTALRDRTKSARGHSGSTRWKSGCFTNTTSARRRGARESVVRGTM